MDEGRVADTAEVAQVERLGRRVDALEKKLDLEARSRREAHRALYAYIDQQILSFRYSTLDSRLAPGPKPQAQTAKKGAIATALIGAVSVVASQFFEQLPEILEALAKLMGR